MNNYVVGMVIGLAVWLAYFTFIDWLFMKTQGLEYFKFFSSVQL